MFYCEECREARGWPESLARSRGACEMCGQAAVCYDVPSSALPPPPEQAVHQQTHFVALVLPVTGRGGSEAAAEGAANLAATTRASALGEVFEAATVGRGPSAEEAIAALDTGYLHSLADESPPPYTTLTVPTKLLARAQRLWDEMGALADEHDIDAPLSEQREDERREQSLRTGLLQTLCAIAGLKEKEKADG